MCWLGADSRVVKMARLGRELVIGSQFSLGGNIPWGGGYMDKRASLFRSAAKKWRRVESHMPESRRLAPIVDCNDRQKWSLNTFPIVTLPVLI